MSDYVDLPVKERMKTFLFNEKMADVHFLVGSDAVQERIPANKFLLATASEVFHGQLYGRFDVPNPIEVVDTTPQTFKTVLLGQGIAKILPHLHLVDDENAESIWDSIAMHADMALKSPEFLKLSHDNVCDIVRRDDLNVDELTVFNSAVAWTKAECIRWVC